MDATNGRGGSHVSDQIDLYLTGALDAEREQRFEEHLLRCASCRTEADESSEVALAVAALPSGFVAELEDADRSTPAGGDRVSGVASARPAGRGSSTSDSRRPPARRRSRARPVLAYLATLLVGALLGGGWTLYQHREPDPVPAANGTATGTQGQLAATVTPRSGGAEVRAVTVGLRPGVRYELLAVSTDGRTLVVADGVAAGGPQTIVGTVRLRPDQCRFFAVIQGAGDVLLVAPAG
ncbi:zf-HC2 domain-containing protein [Micromonospora sp. NPDC051141]|uniref:zf-HC2 domain-containing protein n=1 Tax=Micromonospora sp. NPDC051141 TaxID=3364284 RepID=UPI00379E7841